MRVDESYPKQDTITKQEDLKQTPSFVENVELPSKGLLYPKSSPLSSGTVTIKYMTAKEEDILTTQSFIQDGSVIDRFLESIIVTENVRVKDMLPGDVNAIMIQARILGYGEDYQAKVQTPSGKAQLQFIDLSKLEIKYMDESLLEKNHVNEFSYELPTSKKKIKFKLISYGELSKYQELLENSLKQKNKSRLLTKSADATISGYLKKHIVEVEGNRQSNYISNFVDSMLAKDSRVLRQYINDVAPNVDLSVEVADQETGETFQATVEFGTQFFWPDF